MQNVHAMRPEVRARHAHALTRIGGDDVFLRRFERYYTELRDPLLALYGDDPRFPPRSPRCSTLAAPRAPATRSCARLDHEREIARLVPPRAGVGYVCYADRFAGTLRACASAWTTCASWASPTST